MCISGGHPREVPIGNLVSCGPQLIHDLRNAHRVPDQYGIGKQAEAACLVHDLLGVAGAKLAAVGEEQTPANQFMPGLTTVELKLNTVP